MRFFPSLLSFTLLSSLLAVAVPLPLCAQTEQSQPQSTASESKDNTPVTAHSAEAIDSTKLSPPPQSVVAGAHELTLNEAIERAMARSYSVAQAEATRDAQKEASRGAISRLGPSATVSYNELRFGKQQVANFGGQNLILRGDATKNGSLIVTQPITGLYGYIENARLNTLQENITEEQLRQAKADAGFAGAQAFLNAYATEEQVSIEEASVAAAKSAFNDANVMNRVGRINQADFLKFQLSLTQAETRLSQARATRTVAIVNLRRVTQMPDQETFYLKKELPEPKNTEVATEQSIAAAMKDRPDIKTAEMNAEAVGFSKKLAYTEFIPSVDVFGQLDRNFGEITALGNQERNVQYWGVRAQWTFWNNGSSIFKVREAFAKTRGAEAAYASAKDGVRVEVIQAVENLKAARETLHQAEAGIKQAAEAYRIDQIRYKNGGITASDRILSESTQSSVQGQWVAARTNLLGWYFQLQKAMGQEKPTL
ncbi:MAG: TolC family protein [Chitinophagaceae bacterium]|nr:TolC family protein [Oligoflexus sp.]